MSKLEKKFCHSCNAEKDVAIVEYFSEYSIYRCRSCEMQFAYPIPPECPIFPDFSFPASEIFLNLKKGVSLDNFLTPTETYALKWAKAYLKRGDVIFEICFEAGRCLVGGKRLGFQVSGCDPVEAHADVLSKNGFDVSKGLLPTINPMCTNNPKLILLLETLVRIPNPLEFLKSIKNIFPKSVLIVSVPSPHRSLKAPGFDRRSDYPPHHLTRWSKESLKNILDLAGYSSEVRMTYINAKSLEVPEFLRCIVRVVYRLIGEADYSLVAVAKPKN